MPPVVDTLLKHLLDNRFYWSILEGPLYNVLIYRVLDRWYDEFFRTLPIPRGANILDVGSGAGQATLRLAVQHPEASICGIDYAVSQVRIAQLLQKYRKVHNIEFKMADALRIPFRDDGFDVVVSLGSIKHWLDAKKGLAEIHRVLKSDGFAYIVECDADATREEIEELAERATRFFPLKRAIAWYMEHVVFGQSCAKDQVSRLARSVGYREVIIKRTKQLPFFQLVLRK